MATMMRQNKVTGKATEGHYLIPLARPLVVIDGIPLCRFWVLNLRGNWDHDQEVVGFSLRVEAQLAMVGPAGGELWLVVDLEVEDACLGSTRAGRKVGEYKSVPGTAVWQVEERVS